MSLINRNQKNLLANDVKYLMDIFSKLNWKLDIDNEQTSSHREVFDKFCDFLELLNKEEKELVLELTEDFVHYTYYDYPSLLNKVLSDFPNDIIEESNALFITRLLSPKDKGKTKSSSAMTYMCRYLVLPKISKFNKFSTGRIFSYDEPDLISEKSSGRKNALVLLLDDFIGSGDTALEAIEYYNNQIRNSSDRIILVSLVAQIEGILRIEQLGYDVFYAELRERAISDSAKITNKLKALEVMRGIEERMEVKKDYSLGYKNSQALVSMIRTPNNTLPIYWWKKKPNGDEWDGIFTRK
jgi:hypothetical protein